MSLSGKTALVVGGGTGIGRAVVFALAGEGAKVIVAGRREEPLQEVVALNKGSGEVLIRTADLADRQGTFDLVNWAQEQLGQIDIVVNSAGLNVTQRSMAELSPEDWDLMLNVNATGAFNLMHAVLPEMRKRGDGLIVNISSVAGIRASTLGGVGYSASKFAMAALGLTAALEDGHKGIRISNIYPGEVETPILDKRPVPVSAEHRARILQPEDVAAAVLLLCQLPARAHIPELTIKPTSQDFA
ncbi:putative oxidoreductase [Polystyrenella longa]|uniref:Putative oxidoreductase n=1 Tax=Polystyrenella longa TaxID=2528007 RepID=A0A518CLY0_9PLAN|nr:SDR family oxidoreductase [Polystyrenella longa]QDU80240.1 putative oxidoreductase [Polystyrenella longa]